MRIEREPVKLNLKSLATMEQYERKIQELFKITIKMGNTASCTRGPFLEISLEKLHEITSE